MKSYYANFESSSIHSQRFGLFFSIEAHTLDYCEKSMIKNICEFFLNKTVYNIFDQEKESLGFKKIKSMS